MNQECLNKISRCILAVYMVVFPIMIYLGMFNEKFQNNFMLLMPWITWIVLLLGFISVIGLVIILIKGMKSKA